MTGSGKHDNETSIYSYTWLAERMYNSHVGSCFTSLFKCLNTIQQGKQCMYNVIPRRIRVTIVAGEKQ